MMSAITIIGNNNNNNRKTVPAVLKLLIIIIGIVTAQQQQQQNQNNSFVVPNPPRTVPATVVVIVDALPLTTQQQQYRRQSRMLKIQQSTKEALNPTRRGGSGATSAAIRSAATTVQEDSFDCNNTDDGNHDDNGNDTRHDGDQSHSKNWGMTIALCTSYFTVMGAKCALPSVLSLLLSPTIGLTFPSSTTITTSATTSAALSLSPQQMMAQQLTLATASVAIGKLILGPIIDYYGGKQSLQVSLFSLFICLLVISCCQSFIIFGIAWIVIDFIFSACWPACINTIHEYYTTPTDWSIQIGYLAASARAGNTVAFLLFASIIHIVTKYFPNTIQQSWRPVFFVAACIQLIPLTLLSINGKKKDNDNSNSDMTTDSILASGTRTPVLSPATPKVLAAVSNVLRREVPKLDFWLHLINRSMLMIYGSFLLFVPTYMTQIFHTTNTYGAQIGSFYAMGCLLSVTTISKYYPNMSKRTKLWYITLLLLFGATGSSLLQLAHVSGAIHLSTVVSSILLFTWGFSFAVPFYIPPSLYALSSGSNGGPTSSTATITDIFDIGGFTLLAVFNGYVTSINHTQLSAWIPTFGITTCCAILSYLALFITTWRER